MSGRIRSQRSIKVEAQAQKVLQETGCLQAPVPVDIIAERLGLRLEPAMLGEDISGLLVIEQGRGTIGYNKDHALVRQRFSIAHEIGHFILHQTKAPVFIDKTYTIYRRDGVSSSGSDYQEIQANQFAAALLMPESLLRNEIEHVGFDLANEIALDYLAEKFGVSRQAMSFRLANLNIL
jgi:Zn-dependent peptidase ImmA (M78 family)